METFVAESERRKKMLEPPTVLLVAGVKVVKPVMKKSEGVGQVRAGRMGEVRARGSRARKVAAAMRCILGSVERD